MNYLVVNLLMDNVNTVLSIKVQYKTTKRISSLSYSQVIFSLFDKDL